MVHTDQLIVRVRSYAEHRGWRPSKLARQAGLSVNALARMQSPDWNPSADTLRKLEKLIPPDFIPDPVDPPTSANEVQQ